MNDDYEPVLEDPDLGGVDWTWAAIAALGGFAIAAGLAAWWTQKQ